MRALLIGGTGFIGSYLTPELQRLGADVAVLTRGRSGNPGPEGLTRITGDRKAAVVLGARVGNARRDGGRVEGCVRRPPT